MVTSGHPKWSNYGCNRCGNFNLVCVTFHSFPANQIIKVGISDSRGFNNSPCNGEILHCNRRWLARVRTEFRQLERKFMRNFVPSRAYVFRAGKLFFVRKCLFSNAGRPSGTGECSALSKYSRAGSSSSLVPSRQKIVVLKGCFSGRFPIWVRILNDVQLAIFRPWALLLHLVRPQLLRNHFFGCQRKECNQGFQETYTLYTFTRFCTSHGPPNAKKCQKVMFLHFFHLFGTIL